jgi:phospholipase C
MMKKFPLSALILSALYAHNSYAQTTTPIEHVIVLVGENRTFDNLYGVYQPKKKQTISNLWSKGIVKADGSPGPNYHLAAQKQRKILLPTHRRQESKPLRHLPQPYAAGAFGQRHDVPDARFPADMPNGPYQITKHVSYGAHTGDPVHRFFQMWQQINGGNNDLFVWVAEMTGVGPSNVPAPFAPGRTYQGGIAMGFYNMSTGDAPIFKKLADNYAIADNYHQPVMGGTTANYLALATGDVTFYTDQGKPAVPPVKMIENPDPQPAPITGTPKTATVAALIFSVPICLNPVRQAYMPF